MNDNRPPAPTVPPRNDYIVHKLNEDNERLKESLQLSEAKLISLGEEAQTRDKKTRELEIALSKSRTELKRLNTIIIKSGVPDGGPSDDQVCADFRSIRDSILKIARGYYQAAGVSLPNLRKDSITLVKKQHEWLANWSRDTPEIRNYRIQGAMFDKIYTSIFSKPVFGVHAEFERQLSEFEEEMAECPESKSSCSRKKDCLLIVFHYSLPSRPCGVA